MTQSSPESRLLGALTPRTITVDTHPVSVHIADGPAAATPVVLIPGSGPGASAWSNWRPLIGELAGDRKVIAPDLYGFASTPAPPGMDLNVHEWSAQVIGVLDAEGIDSAHLVGNSYGAAIALHTALTHPQRIGRVALTGGISLRHAITPGLRATWSYTPSRAAMRHVLEEFAYDRALVTDSLVEQRYAATVLPGVDEAFRSAFHEPLQDALDAACHTADELSGLTQPTLIIHGREDRIIPVQTSIDLVHVIPDARLHVLGQCGHWTAVERTAELTALLRAFLSADEA